MTRSKKTTWITYHGRKTTVHHGNEYGRLGRSHTKTRKLYAAKPFPNASIRSEIKLVRADRTGAVHGEGEGGM